MEMGDLQTREWRQQPWRRRGSFLRKVLGLQGEAGDSSDTTAPRFPRCWVGSCSPHHPELGTVDVQSDLAMCGGGGFPLPQREVCTGVQTCQPLLQFLGRTPRALLSRAKQHGVPPTNP